MTTDRKAEIEVLRRKIAEKEQRIAELRRQAAERRYEAWRHQILEWASGPNPDVAEMPRAPEGMFSVAELTDEERQAREALIANAREIAKKYGVVK